MLRYGFLPTLFYVTPGHHANIRAAPDLIAKAGRFHHLLGDRGYEADPLRERLRTAGATPRP